MYTDKTGDATLLAYLHRAQTDEHLTFGEFVQTRDKYGIPLKSVKASLTPAIGFATAKHGSDRFFGQYFMLTHCFRSIDQLALPPDVQ